MTAITKEELLAKIKPLQARLHKLESKEAHDRAAALVGKCFKFRNNYSCPEKPSDYWWGYVRVLRAVDGTLTCLTFEKRKGGSLIVETVAFHVPQTIESYTPISRAELRRAWQRVVENTVTDTVDAALG